MVTNYRTTIGVLAQRSVFLCDVNRTSEPARWRSMKGGQASLARQISEGFSGYLRYIGPFGVGGVAAAGEMAKVSQTL